MNHRRAGYKLGRNTKQRQALFKSLIRSFFTHGFTTTTFAKAKSVRGQIDKLIVVAKKNDLNSRRQLYKFFNNRAWVNRIHSQINANFADLSSNFTSLKKIGYRTGDDALMVKLALVKKFDFKPPKAEKKLIKNKKVSPAKKAENDTKDIKNKKETKNK